MKIKSEEQNNMENKSSSQPESQNQKEVIQEKPKTNPFFINYKDLFLANESESSKEDPKEKKENSEKNIVSQKENEELTYLNQLYTYPPITKDSFKNLDFKLRFQSNRNIKYIDSYNAQYTGKGVSKVDYGIIQTEKEITNTRPIFYYEVLIKDDGKKADLSIGFGEKDISEKCLLLGSTSRSYGYHSKGKSYNNKKANKYGEEFEKNDIIGCGADLENKSIFFTKNGKFLDFAFKDVNFDLGKGYFYPSICMHTLNIHVEINFGKNDFKFDIKEYYENNLGKKYNMLQKINPNYDEMDNIVKEYLFHEGYLNTLKSMMAKNDDDEFKNEINMGDKMIIEEEENNNIEYDKDEDFLDNVIKLLPVENINIGTKEDKKEEKKEDKKEEKKEEKKEGKKE